MAAGGKICWICSSDRHMDDHHYDCLKGELSPETVPLCRRCHVTYHVWGVGAFSPDTTERALAVENRRREILRSLPHDHPQYHRAELLGILEPLKMGDVRRSRYWYRKWGIKPPESEKRKARIRGMQVRLPNNPALCGDDWLRDHMNDHSIEDIGELAIEVDCGVRRLPPFSMADKRGSLKKALREVGG